MSWATGARRAFAAHWQEYTIEGLFLGTFMISACCFTVLLWHPSSPVRMSVASADLRRFMTGLAMGTTAVLLIYSPLGQRSGAHMNPVTTFTFYRLGKVARWDAIFYVLFQFIGGTLGVTACSAVLGNALAHREVNFAITQPGARGVAVAFTGEACIAFLLMTVILNLSNSGKYSRFTGIAAGILVMLFITFESPLSGMSMNPARSFASDFVAMRWRGLWIYFLAPLIGMLAGAELFVRTRGLDAVICAKLHHPSRARCIFRCGYMQMAAAQAAPIHSEL